LVQQLQFLQVQGLQRQPPLAVVQAQSGALVSIDLSIVILLCPRALIRIA
jgi:hypothetical protein